MNIRHALDRLTGKRWREIVLALLLLLCYGFFQQGTLWNEPSHFDLVASLVNDHTTRIDHYAANTGDKDVFQGHYYSDKSPGTALLSIPAYLVLKAVTTLRGQGPPTFDAAEPVLVFTVCVLPTVLLVLLLLHVLRPVVGEGLALVLCAGYGLGSMALPFATLYFEHALSTFLLFATFVVLWRYGDRLTSERALLAGALAGWGVLTEYPTALGVACLFLYLLAKNRRAAVFFLLGGLPELAILGTYDWVSFGNPLELGYQYQITFGSRHRQGFEGVGLPSLAGGRQLIFSPWGLLQLSPWLALTPLGLWGLRLRRWRKEALLCLGIIVLFLLYNSGFFNLFGGRAPGPRYLLPALPFATVLLAMAPPAVLWSAGVLIIPSIGRAALATLTLPEVPEVVVDPLRDQWLPQWAAGDLTTTTAWLRWGLVGRQPALLLALAGAVALVALIATAIPGRTARAVRQIGVTALAFLVVALGTPLDLRLPAPFGAASAAPDIVIQDVGVTPLIWPNQALRMRPWAQLEDQGGAVSLTTAVWSIYYATDNRVYVVGQEKINWQPGQRMRLFIEWDTANLPAGAYRLGLAIESQDHAITYVSNQDTGSIRVGRDPTGTHGAFFP